MAAAERARAKTRDRATRATRDGDSDDEFFGAGATPNASDAPTRRRRARTTAREATRARAGMAMESSTRRTGRER